MSRFTSFVLLGGMRTGSNFLEANLNALPGVHCLGELFNPHFIGKKDQTEAFGFDLAARDRDPLAVLARVRSAQDGLTGFRLFHDHDVRVLDSVLADASCAKIVLTRNPLDSYVSLKIAQETGQWMLRNPKNLKTAKVRFDGEEFAAHVAAQQEFQLSILHALQISGQTAFYLDYEDIGDVAVLSGLARFLGVDAAIEAPDSTLKKQNPEEIETKVSNPAAIATALQRLDRFNLSRTPNFEPRRGPAVPAMIVARDASLLFLPIKGGPEAEVAAWLAAVGGGTDSGLSQKDLRQWKRARPGHRSFTVLRHPVERAYVAFVERVVTGPASDVRRALQRQHGLDLPAIGETVAQEQRRSAFLGFLRFVRMNLSGQTAMKVDAHWATQAAIIQGFAQIVPPDAILRETDATETLAELCGQVGCPVHVYTGATAPEDLATIYDDGIERAAQEAFQRDYVTFGFARWR
ncbi:sulfotransferase family 2 domain-containing protein [Tabrizicola sp. J26]|uniref:sulfotransferase family 2 domain-containing protein n=1 Tax=Alitabrizicola rongguiensis TaxID=2909234 RepID=UPI001F3DE73E|nr:sulfotransferase family 2 domain-containing protein [Tabrizicola rongguiensis]MCF1708289.1 sulfotransferase family 2 domain-containing protein [Tabrizicola rongguiensis]